MTVNTETGNWPVPSINLSDQQWMGCLPGSLYPRFGPFAEERAERMFTACEWDEEP